MNIGIVTHYYNSTNYGGNLQAYALCIYLNTFEDVVAQQICVDTRSKTAKSITDIINKKGLSYIFRKALGKAKVSAFNTVYKRKIASAKIGINQRRDAILSFGKNIVLHSDRVYSLSDIEDANDFYDVFITGSDQVWHPLAWNKAYRLDFANSKKTKISYAASIATDSLSEHERYILKDSLKDYTAISVREKNAIDIVLPLTSKDVIQVVDPVFLLSDKDWDAMLPKRTNGYGDYLFCYFLGDDKNGRKAAEQYAKKYNLKIITLPYLNGKYRRCDEHFGDVRLYEVSPLDFVWLIKNASAVFTDSFHALAFSIIYNKGFFVFERTDIKKMSSRIISILQLVCAEDRFIAHDGFNIDADFTPLNIGKLDKVKAESVEFLKKSLKRGFNEG